MKPEKMWQCKVLAFIHDPAEKALILLRGRGHEEGTVKALRKRFEPKMTDFQSLEQLVKRADHWAAAADRPSLPRGRGGRVVFADEPTLIHPLTGETFRLQSLAEDVPSQAIEAVSFDRFQDLIIESNGKIDWERTFLAFWRFGPESPADDLGVLWGQLPADTRSPDHTIWEHLSLSSAFAGALAADPDHVPALFVMSFGPVQGFIAQSRSVSDLWAGSHLLSRIAWEGMRLICEAYGPDAVLFPNLRGIPQADLWLNQKLGSWLNEKKPLWKKEKSDANPLFAAALPNRFVALVGEKDASRLASEIEQELRRWVLEQAESTLKELLEMSGSPSGGDAHQQIRRQLRDFPEVHWAAVPWRLAGSETLQDDELKSLLQTLGARPEYLDETLDGLLRKRIVLDDVEFYRPNPGVAYPGLFEAMERLHAAAKSHRRFSGGMEEGYRCSLCGEWEWLASQRGDPAKPTGIFAPTGQRGDENFWKTLAARKPALARDGEYLCTRCAMKRLWPRRFVKEIETAVEDMERVDRFVISTHAMAVSTSILRRLEKEARGGKEDPSVTQRRARAEEKLRNFMENAKDLRGAALPNRLYKLLHSLGRGKEDIGFYRKLPALMDAAEKEQERDTLRSLMADFFGTSPEAYYGLVLMDGDQLGAWLSGERGRMELEKRFHPTTLEDLRKTDELKDYLGAGRPGSPAYHQTISSALNSFALHLARTVVEELFMGKLIYAGGDDLLAMVAIHDLPGLMFALRCAYSGTLPKDMSNEVFWAALGTEPGPVVLRKGFALVGKGKDRRLLRLMGGRATASLGAVIAHHQAPLGRVLANLRQAEHSAKTKGGRDAFCLTVMKRSGGTHHLVGKWSLEEGWAQGDMGLLLDLRNLIAGDVSRRTAYVLSELLAGLPCEESALRSAFRFQFERQGKKAGLELEALCDRLARAACRVEALSDRLTPAACRQDRGSAGPREWNPGNHWLRQLLITAEFLAREGRVDLRI